MAKTKRIANYNKLDPQAESVKILVGYQAWDFAKAGKMARNQAEIELNQTLEHNEGESPLVIASLDEFMAFVDDGGLWKILPKNAYSVSVQRCNGARELQPLEIATLQNQLGKQDSKALYFEYQDEAGLLLADWSETVKAIRKREKTLTDEQTDRKPIQTTPYIEKRTESDLEGLFFVIPKLDKDTGAVVAESTKWLSDSITVIGRGSNGDEDFIVLQKDRQNEPLVMPLKDVGEREGWQFLKKHGVTVTSKSGLKAELADYLQLKSRNAKRYHIAEATGWNDELTAFVMPNGDIIGNPTTETLFRNQSQTANGYEASGTVEEWRDNVGRLCVGNPSMMLAVGVALSAPLLKLLNADSYGVHLFEDSTFGKTTTLNIASSVYGHPKTTRTAWNATPLALQNEAHARNGLFMPLDEISEATPKAVAQTAYSLFNGQGKLQGAKEGGNRKALKWQVANLSTGEEGLESYLLQQGIKVNAGQLVRLLNIPMKRAVNYHGLADGKAHADTLNQNVMQFYGSLGREWITWLINADKPALKAFYEQVKQNRLNTLPDTAEPQIKRVVADRFALIETALVLAKPFLNWHESDITNAITANFNEWVNAYGWHSKKHTQIIEQVNDWLLVNADSRFEEYPFNGQQPAIKNKAGYRLVNDGGFYVFKSVFEFEALAGQSKEVALPVLVKAQMLKEGDNKGYKYLTRLPHKIAKERTRVYLVQMLDESDAEE